MISIYIYCILSKSLNGCFLGHAAGFLDSRAATWGGSLRGLSEFQALKECLINFIWAKHQVLCPMDDCLNMWPVQINSFLLVQLTRLLFYFIVLFLQCNINWVKKGYIF
jgi:hypothetical protein